MTSSVRAPLVCNEVNMTAEPKVQYKYCPVCRRNHDEGRKHVFTTKHKNRLAQLLSKFGLKVRSARKVLHKPNVLEGELEPGARVWCYCCEAEVMKHVSDGHISVEWGGLLEHMASSDHHKKTRHYWWFNGAESKQLQNFLLFEAEYQRYKRLVADAVKVVEHRKEQRLKEAAVKLRAQEEAQMQVARECPSIPPPRIPVYVTVTNQYGVMQNPTGWHEGMRVWGGGMVRYKHGSDQLLKWTIDDLEASSGAGHSSSAQVGKYTAAAFGVHLTSIGTQALSADDEGNVHSGATPPWLREEEEEEGERSHGCVFGPSEEEFLKHKEHQRRASKNPKRVGANFHRIRQKIDDDNWLPSFGRVWNAGPRSHTMMEFRREQTKKPMRHSLPTSSPSTSATSAAVMESVTDGSSSIAGTSTIGKGKLPQIKPYVRKRGIAVPQQTSTGL